MTAKQAPAVRARAIAIGELYGDAAAAAEFGVSVVTIRHWRGELAEDASLLREYQRVSDQLVRQWSMAALAAYTIAAKAVVERIQNPKQGQEPSLMELQGIIRVFGEQLVQGQAITGALGPPSGQPSAKLPRLQ